MAIMQEDEEVNMAKCGDNIRIRLKNAEEEVHISLPSFLVRYSISRMPCLDLYCVALKPQSRQ
jgi:hypothetical protein